MARLVTIFGGSGFLGRYVAQRMARNGWRVRVAVRRPNQAMFVKPYGAVGQVEPVFCNIRDDASVQAATAGADAVVNCVGILAERGQNSFEALHQEGAARIARISTMEGVGQFVHMSAIGAASEASSKYCQSKALGEQAVLEHFPAAVIIRPSVIFGAEDQFFNKFAAMTKLGPVLPIVGGDTRFQPVFVDDIAKAVAAGVLGDAKPGIYELGGPEVKSLKALMAQMLDVIERRRFVLNLPFWAGVVVGGLFDILQYVSVGLISNTILTRDQVKSLRDDGVVSPAALRFEDLGIEPTAMETELPEYLWPNRPSGQYSAIKSSAKNLKA